MGNWRIGDGGTGIELGGRQWQTEELLGVSWTLRRISRNGGDGVGSEGQGRG